MKNEVIEHIGIVEKVEDNRVVVRILQASACSGCKARSFCASSENKEKMIEVNTSAAGCRIGDEVTVCAQASVGRDAVILAFVLPLILMLTALIVCMKVTGSEPISALAAIAVLVPYYALIYTQKHRLQKKMNFWIRE